MSKPDSNDGCGLTIWVILLLMMGCHTCSKTKELEEKVHQLQGDVNYLKSK